MSSHKVLVTVSFAIDGLEEDALGGFVAGVEDGLRRGIAAAVRERPVEVTDQMLDEAIEFYGATITLRRPLFSEQGTDTVS